MAGVLARLFRLGRTAEMAEASRVPRELASAIAPRSTDPDLVTFLGLLPNPDRILRKLGRTDEVFDDVLTDAHVASVVASRKGAVLSREWGVRPASARRADRKAAELCEQVLPTLRMREALTSLLDAPLWGRAYLEVMWELRDGMVVPVQLLPRPQRRFVYGEQEELRVLTRTAALVGDRVPARKILQARNHPTYDNPYGDAALSRCFWPYAFKKAGFKWWTAFAERYGMPWVIGTLPRGASDPEKLALDTALSRAVVDAVLRVTEGTKIELVQAAGTTSSQVYDAFTSANNAEISKAILGQTLTTEMGDTGSFAAAKVHGDVREDIAQTDEALVAETMCELLGWITELNFQGATAPEFYFYAEERPATEWVDLIEKARKARIPVPVAWALQKAGIPEAEDGEAVLPEDAPADTSVAAPAEAEFASEEEVVFDPVENRQAIDWMRSRIVLTPDEWKLLPEDMQPRAFTVGGVDDIDALEELHGWTTSALEDGATVGEWVKGTNARLTQRGLEAMPRFRAETVFRTNALQALAVGRHAQLREVASARPYWMYDAVDDDATRPAHRAMDGRVFAADDAIWDTWYPSNGFNCRCRVRSLSARELASRGLQLERGADVVGQLVEMGGQAVQIVPDAGFATNAALAPEPRALVRQLGERIGAGASAYIRRALLGGESQVATKLQLGVMVRVQGEPESRWGTAKQLDEDVEKLADVIGEDLAEAVEVFHDVVAEVIAEPDEVEVFLFEGRRQVGFVKRRVDVGGGDELEGVGVIYDVTEDRLQGCHDGYHLPGSRKNWKDREEVRQ